MEGVEIRSSVGQIVGVEGEQFNCGERAEEIAKGKTLTLTLTSRCEDEEVFEIRRQVSQLSSDSGRLAKQDTGSSVGIWSVSFLAQNLKFQHQPSNSPAASGEDGKRQTASQ